MEKKPTKSKKIQGRVAHYFRALRRRKKMSQSEYSRACCFSLNQLKRFESDQESSVSRAIKLLSQVGELDDKNIFEFCQYVLGKKLDYQKMDAWESILLKKMSKVSLVLRQKFIHGYLNSLDCNKELNDMIETLLVLKGLSSSEHDVVMNVARAFKKAKNERL